MELLGDRAPIGPELVAAEGEVACDVRLGLTEDVEEHRDVAVQGLLDDEGICTRVGELADPVRALHGDRTPAPARTLEVELVGDAQDDADGAQVLAHEAVALDRLELVAPDRVEPAIGGHAPEAPLLGGAIGRTLAAGEGGWTRGAEPGARGDGAGSVRPCRRRCTSRAMAERRG